MPKNIKYNDHTLQRESVEDVDTLFKSEHLRRMIARLLAAIQPIGWTQYRTDAKSPSRFSIFQNNLQLR